MDFYIFQQINQLAGGIFFLDSLGIFLAEYSGYILITLLLGLFFRDRKNRAMVVEALFAALLAGPVIARVIKFLYLRPRPFIEHEVNLLLAYTTESSFPSGHAASFFALSFVVYFFNKKSGALFLAASFLMGVARVFVGLHYPLDILGGILVGFVSAWAVNEYLKGHIQKVFSS